MIDIMDDFRVLDFRNINKLFELSSIPETYIDPFIKIIMDIIASDPYTTYSDIKITIPKSKKLNGVFVADEEEIIRNFRCLNRVSKKYVIELECGKLEQRTCKTFKYVSSHNKELVFW